MNAEPQSPAPAPAPAPEGQPAAGSARTPVWMLVLLLLLAFWGMAFLDRHGGEFNAQVYPPYQTVAELDEDWPKTGGPDLAKGRRNFVQYCAPCHQESGLGNPANNVPPLVHSQWVLAESPNRLVRIVLNGLQGPVEVDGKQFNSNGMLPWRDTITDDEVIANILTFIRQNKEWGHNAPEILPAQVTKIRDETKDRAVQYTIDELLKVPEP